MGTMTQYYDHGTWGYMGVGPTPNKGFTLTVTWNQTVSEGWWTADSWNKLGILFYDPSDHTRYAVHKTAYITATAPISGSTNRMIVGNASYAERRVPAQQQVTLSYDAANWEFYGGFSRSDLSGAAICFYTLDPVTTGGGAPNGCDNASIGWTSETLSFTYELIPERFASTIDGSNIYAKRAECDNDGNPINTTYATKSELAGKQDKLTAGTNITIDSDGVISAEGGGQTYTAGTGIDIDSDGEVSIDSTVATKDYVQNAVQGKADSATTLAGYGITDAYTKTQVDNALGDKQKKLVTGTHIDLDSDGNIDTKGLQATLTDITDIQVVAALPASPVATVLYLIPEA